MNSTVYVLGVTIYVAFGGGAVGTDLEPQGAKNAKKTYNFNLPGH